MMTRILLGLFCAVLSVHAAKPEAPLHVIDADSKTGSARAVIVQQQPMAYTTQILPLNQKGEVIGIGKIDRQLAAVVGSLGNALHDGGSDLGHAVKINVYAADDQTVAATQKFFSKVFKRISSPAVTYVVGKLSHPDALVAMDAIGISVRLPSESSVHRERSKNIPGQDAFADVAILPQGGVIYISGQAQKGALPEATTKTLEQLEQTLKFLKLEKKDIVSAKAFVEPATDAAVVRAQFARFFHGELVPALSIVDWKSAKDLPIEIEMVVAARGTGADTKERISYLCPPFMTPSPVYSKIARVNSGNLIYFSGITGRSTNGADIQIHEIFAGLKEALKKTGSDLDHLAKSTYYVATPDAGAKLNEIRPKYYNPKTAPAASKAMIKSVGFPGKAITFDMIAVTAE